MIEAKVWLDRFEQFAPQSLAEPGDPVGMQIGDPYQEVRRVLVTLDVRPEVVEEAIEKKVDFIFAHHPTMFRPAKNLETLNPQNKMYAELLKHDIGVYAAHTNLDSVKGGMNDWLADALGLEHQEVLDVSQTFEGYEVGLGKIGNLVQPISVDEFVELCKKAFHVEHLRLTAPNNHNQIQRIAVLGGDGGKFYPIALAKGADAYVTGDVYYHTAHDMLAEGLVVVDPGHHFESICKGKLVTLFNQWNQEDQWHVEFMPSDLNTDPFEFR